MKARKILALAFIVLVACSVTLSTQRLMAQDNDGFVCNLNWGTCWFYYNLDPPNSNRWSDSNWVDCCCSVYNPSQPVCQ